MIPEKVKEVLKKQHYEIVGKHSAVQVCHWTKKSLRDQGVCYKEKFYGIKSHRCCQMTPAVMWCPNQCEHCWRAIELNLGDKLGNEINSPSAIIDGCIEAQKKLLEGFKKSSGDPSKFKRQVRQDTNMEKFEEAQEPMQFAISLSGEPTLYPKIGSLIEELRKRKKTSFLVTNGLYPQKLKELLAKGQKPTQLYISVNTSNEKDYTKFHKSSIKNAWEKLNESLSLMSQFPRSVFRINLIKTKNMSQKNILEFAELIKEANPKFIELKGFMSVGFARARLGYDKMPWHKDMQKFAKELVENLGGKWKILDEHEVSRAIVLGKDKKELKIKWN